MARGWTRRRNIEQRMGGLLQDNLGKRRFFSKVEVILQSVNGMGERSVTDMIRDGLGHLPFITVMRTVKGGRTVFITFESPDMATEVVEKLRWLKTRPRKHEQGERT